MKQSTHATKCEGSRQAPKVNQILIVDNDPVILALLAKFLKKDGFRVLTATSGAVALKILKSVTPDVILLDLVMPNISGDRLCRMIRGMDTAAKDVHIIIVSAMASEGVAIDYLGMGADDCIGKAAFNETYRNITEALSRFEQQSQKNEGENSAAAEEIRPSSIISELISINRNHEMFISNISEGRLELSKDERVLYASPAAISLLGLPELDIISVKLSTFFQTEDQATVARLLSKKRQSQSDERTSFRLLNAREVIIKVLYVAEEDKYTVIMRDITEQKGFERALLKAYEDLETRVAARTTELAKANETLNEELQERRKIEGMLKQSRNTLRSVFDSISDPLIMVDHDLCIRMANRATVEYFGYADYLEILGKSFVTLSRDYFGTELLKSLESSVLRFEASSFESYSPERSGRYEKLFIYPTHDEHRDSGAAIVRINDVTKEKIMSMQLIQQEKLAVLGLLVSSVTHEINNPNNFISFNIPILREALQEILPVLDAHAAGTPNYEVQGMPYVEFRSDVIKLLENIEHGSVRINATVGKLKEFSRKRGDKGAKLIFPTKIIERAVAICGTQICKTVKTFDVQMQEAIPPMTSDPDAIEQILINLLINAAQAADKPNSYIRLKVRRVDSGDEGLILEVEDNGCGMDKNTASRIFDPFFTTKEEGLGTGLGLYISKSLLESIGGSIAVESEIGKETTFRIFIPDLKAVNLKHV